MRTGKTLQEAKAGTTWPELLAWKRFFEEEWGDTTPLMYYLAQIAAEIRRGHVKRPENVRTEDFLIKFKRLDKDATPVRTGAQPTLEQSKTFWIGGVQGRGRRNSGSAS